MGGERSTSAGYVDIPGARVPGRPVLSEKTYRRIAELVAAAPPLSDEQRAAIGAHLRTGRRIAQAHATERAA